LHTRSPNPIKMRKKGGGGGGKKFHAFRKGGSWKVTRDAHREVGYGKRQRIEKEMGEQRQEECGLSKWFPRKHPPGDID